MNDRPSPTVPQIGPPSPWASQPIRILSALLALSLLLHILTLVYLLTIREYARQEVAALAAAVGAARDDTLSTEIAISERVPIRTEVPIQRTIQVPIDVVIPLSTTINVPLRTPLGNYDIPVPIEGQFPVDVSAPVTIDESVPISTTVAIDLDVPIRVPIRETPLDAYLAQLQDALDELVRRL